jgi:hypothetical protein
MAISPELVNRVRECKYTSPTERIALVDEIDRLRGVLEKIAETGGWPGGSHADAVDLANAALADGEGVGK